MSTLLDVTLAGKKTTSCHHGLSSQGCFANFFWWFFAWPLVVSWLTCTGQYSVKDQRGFHGRSLELSFCVSPSSPAFSPTNTSFTLGNSNFCFLNSVAPWALFGFGFFTVLQLRSGKTVCWDRCRARLLHFLFLRNHNPELLIEQCLKTIVIVFFLNLAF